MVIFPAESIMLVLFYISFQFMIVIFFFSNLFVSYFKIVVSEMCL